MVRESSPVREEKGLLVVMTAPHAADAPLHGECPPLTTPLRVEVGFLLLSITLMVSKVFALETLAGVKDYEVVYPEQLYARYRGDTKVQYPDEVQYGFKVHGEDLVMHLERNKNLLAHDYTETHYLPDGQQVTTSPQILDHCYYHGYVRNDSDSEASISLCNGVRGYFTTQRQPYHIEPLTITEGAAHAVYKYESLESTAKICGVTNDTWLRVPSETFRLWTEIQKQDFLKAKKYVEFLMVTDTSLFKKYDQKTEKVRNRIFEIINNVNLVYKALNIFVALIGIEIWSTNDAIEMTSNSRELLNRFSKWRAGQLLKGKKNDQAHLLSNVDFEGLPVGLAFVGGMCSQGISTSIIQDHTRDIITMAATVAHEMGHTFGMEHDTASCKCPDDSCIMAATLSDPPSTAFSSCSKKQYRAFILKNMPMCLKNKPNLSDLVAPPVCGNGYIEADEQCDCGTPEECHNPCCEAALCKLKPEAVCADGDCCENCQFKEIGTVCRPSKDECDLTDFCDGKSSNCTSDRLRVSGFPCMKGEGYCNMGNCPTLRTQCEDAWGQGAEQASDMCYDANLKGVDFGFCSYFKEKYIACNTNSTKCGKVYCTGGSATSTLFAVKVQFLNCKTVVPQSGYIEDFMMSKSGTKCGSKLVCIKGECVDMESIYGTANCSSKCKEHEVCDHELQCHCEEGWRPPNCDIRIPAKGFIKTRNHINPALKNHRRESCQNEPEFTILQILLCFVNVEQNIENI
ncbi:zinc metalloproteinase-disintegrin-like VMP-III isoform X2 [Lissotriton helveticus]